jgi:CPA1 family monovalent cation:H+ antiporter
LHDDDPVGRELSAARERALRAGLASFAGDSSPAAKFARQAFTARLGYEPSNPRAGEIAHRQIYSQAVDAARQAILSMRTDDEIGDNAFHKLEEELDQLEIAVRSEAE